MLSSPALLTGLSLNADPMAARTATAIRALGFLPLVFAGLARGGYIPEVAEWSVPADGACPLPAEPRASARARGSRFGPSTTRQPVPGHSLRACLAMWNLLSGS